MVALAGASRYVKVKWADIRSKDVSYIKFDLGNG